MSLFPRNWSCPLLSSFSLPLPWTVRDPWNTVIPESRGQNRMCPERSHEIPSSRLLNYFLPAENYSWAISILAEILASPVSSLRSHSYLYSPFLLLISLTNVIGYVIFLYHILVKTIPSRRGCTRKAKVFSPMRETLAILAMISSAMILPIQYLNAPDPSDVHRFACVRFISG